MTASPDLGFLIFLNYDQDGGARRSLDEGLVLFEEAERVGYDSAGVRVHHGVRTLSAPFPFLTAAAQRTSRIRLATAIIPVGYEDPIRFAEDAATADLLSGGRLDLGLSSGDLGRDAEPGERTRLIEEKLSGILAAVRGDVLHIRPETHLPHYDEVSEGETVVAPRPHGPLDPPAEFVALPRSPGLIDRLGYGAGSLSSAVRAARLGLRLVLSTIHGEATGPTLGHTQAELIRRYREEFERYHPGRIPHVAIGRSILPLTDEADRREYGPLVEFYDRLVTSDGRYTGASGASGEAFRGQASPLYAGTPDQIVERLSTDPSLELADELVLTPLSELTFEQKKRLLGTVAEHVAPALGWHGADLGAPIG